MNLNRLFEEVLRESRSFYNPKGTPRDKLESELNAERIRDQNISPEQLAKEENAMSEITDIFKDLISPKFDELLGSNFGPKIEISEYFLIRALENALDYIRNEYQIY